MIRVQIIYEPAVYAEVLARVLEQTRLIQIVDEGSAEADVIIFPLGANGGPQIDLLRRPRPDAKLIALSAQGDRGLVHRPDDREWAEVRPFGLDQLINEVLADYEVTSRARTQAFPHLNRAK